MKKEQRTYLNVLISVVAFSYSFTFLNKASMNDFLKSISNAFLLAFFLFIVTLVIVDTDEESSNK